MTVTPGAPFDIELGSAPTTGYQWQLPTVPDGVALLGRDFHQQPGAAAGDGGTQVFHLRADRAGHFELSFELKRQWEADPIETRTIEVEAS